MLLAALAFTGCVKKTGYLLAVSTLAWPAHAELPLELVITDLLSAHVSSSVDIASDVVAVADDA